MTLGRVLRSTGIAVVAAVSAALPWLVTGMRLPLQNLWADDTPPDRMPRVLLPFSQYDLAFQASVIIIAWAIAGMLVRGHVLGAAGRSFLVVGLVLLILQTAALTQTAVTVAAGLQHRVTGWQGIAGGEGRRVLTGEAQLYLGALVMAAIAAMVIGCLSYWLIARGPVPAAAISLSAGAVAVGEWVPQLAHALGGAGGGTPFIVLDAIAWSPAIVVGLVMCWVGFRGAGRVATLVACLAVLWVGRAAVQSVSAALGSRVLLRQPGEAIDYAVRLFLLMLGPWGGAWPLLVLAVAVLAAGSIGLALLRRAGARARAQGRPRSRYGG